ncbi:MAG TPA: methionine aminotransferase [Vicinamibacterales bacterium]|nr:methionine aminotransferase [Vicinamibacterales bacterium]
MNSLASGASKLGDVGETIFSVMTRLADQHGAINLAQGFPDFDCSPALVEAVARCMREGNNQYAPMQGVASLREALASKILALYGVAYDPATEITITSGATEAMFCAISAFVRPGDEVLLFEPCYDSYVPVVRLNGGLPVFVTLRFPGYGIDWDEVRAAVSPRTRMVIVNSPHNPTGMVFGADDLRQLASILDGTNVILLSDEVYEHVVFDGLRHESVCRLPDLAARSCVVSSFGKTFHTTGWKVGYASAPAALAREIQRVHQFVTFATHTPSQLAYAALVRERTGYEDIASLYEAKRDLFVRLLDGSRFKPIPCRGTYFQLLDHSSITSAGDTAFAMSLLREHGVASIPTSAFLYASEPPPVLRFCFAKRDDTLRRAADRLRQV